MSTIQDMPTSNFDVDYDNSVVFGLMDKFRTTYLAGVNTDRFERKVKRLFVRNARMSYTRDIGQRVDAGEWDIGKTQDERGAELGLDRSRISDLARKGEMSFDTYCALRFASSRPDDLDPTPVQLAAANRSGFVAVAKFYAEFVHDRPQLKIAELNELRHEFLGTILTHFSEWTRARSNSNEIAVMDIIRSVCNYGGRQFLPQWYDKAEAASVRGLIDKLRSDPLGAISFLSELEDNWADIYFMTAQSTEFLMWS